MVKEQPSDTTRRANAEARAIWNRKAAWWDAHFGADGPLFLLDAVERLLASEAGERILEIACGNGALARRLAGRGAEVVATDFSETFLELAQARTTEHAERITYRLVDATDEGQLLGLGPRAFDAAVCAMGLMDMATIEPLMRALAQLLKPDGRVVFSVIHPCFNADGVTKVVEEEDRGGQVVTTYAVKIARYLTPRTVMGTGVIGEPLPHLYFERPLSALLAPAFQAGLALDGLEELAAEPPMAGETVRATSWANFQEIPLFMLGRLRLVGRV